MNKSIIRYFDTEMRAAESEEMIVEGYALKYDKETQIGNKNCGWREKIARTALMNTDTKKVYFNFNHNRDIILAGTDNGSLTLTTDDTGLKIRAKIIDTTDGIKIYKLIKDGLINRMSFAATIGQSKWTMSENKNDLDLREITVIEKLYDVAAVTYPAYDDTPISARTADYEDWLYQMYKKQIIRLDKIIGSNKKKQ